MAITKIQAITFTDQHPSGVSGINSGGITFAFDEVTRTFYQWNGTNWISLTPSYTLLSVNSTLVFSAKYNVYEITAGSSYTLPNVLGVDVGGVCEVINASASSIRINYNATNLYLIGNDLGLTYVDIYPTEVLKVIFNGVDKWRVI
jgi:hypothetical protein